jgi:hypothetical protein
MLPSEVAHAVHRFYVLATQKDPPETVLKQLSALDTFTARVEYAEEHLEHLSSGSSRMIYRLLNGDVLKLAKNERGRAQNKVESNPEMKSKYVNPALKADPDGLWIIVPYLENITEKEFEKMVGVSFEDFGEALRYGLREISGNLDNPKPDNFAKIEKINLYQDLIKLGKKFELLGGDLARISSWRQKDNHPMLADAGLTRDIYDEFYEDSDTKSTSKSKSTPKT